MDSIVTEPHPQVAPPTEEERRTAEALIRTLAQPRLTGSDGAKQVEAELRRIFEGMGYAILDQPFRFSTWPGRFGVPAIGAISLVGTLVGATLLIRERRPRAAALSLLGTGAVLASMAASAPPLIARLPWGRIETANWLVHRPGAAPRTVVVAHRDSKSQTISSLARITSAGCAITGWAALLALAGMAAIRPGKKRRRSIAGSAIGPAAAVASLGGSGLLFCTAGNASPGALDNATGLAALVGIARREAERDDVAFLVTDGEELGLAGARAALEVFPGPLEVINLDGLDDEGSFRIVERFGWPRSGGAPHLARALVEAGRSLGVPIERQDLPIGILVDHIPFARAGWPAVTVMRGTLHSLQRVHRPEDAADRLNGSGAATAVALVSAALQLLRYRHRH